MSQLAVGVNATETLWTVDAVPDPEFGFYTVGSEIVLVTSGFDASDPRYEVGQTFPSRIRVVRATNDTIAASHLAGAALTAVTVSGSGAGDNAAIATGSDEAYAALTATAVDGDANVYADATTSGDGTANADSYATANGAGDASASLTASNLGAGGASASAVATAIDGDADARPRATTSGSGNADARPTATATGSGDADAKAIVTTASGLASVGGSATSTSGIVSAVLQAVTTTGVEAAADLRATRGAVTMGMTVFVDSDSGRLGFNDATPIAKPIVPLTAPAVQDVIDALVALGLISQSD